MLKNIGCLIALVLLPTTGQAQVLAQLVESVLASHPAAQTQRALVTAAQAGTDSARWQFYPTPSIAIESARATASNLSYQSDATVTTLRLQQPLWTGGRLTAGLKKAEAGLAVSQAALEEARQQLALRVVQNYGDWLAAYLKELAHQKSRARHERLGAQVKRRIEMGASSDSDLVLAISRLQTLESDQTVTRAQQQVALARLGQLLGQALSPDLLKSAIEQPRPLLSSAQGAVDLALSINPALLKSRAQARAKEAAVAERQAELLPEVFIRAERQHGNHSAGGTAPFSRVFVGLSSRFGAGLSSLSNAEGAQAEYQAALGEVELQMRAVSEQVLTDHALATSSNQRLQALNESLKSAQAVSESFDRQFLAGRKTWLDVMNAVRELSQTELQLADLQSAQVVLSWRLSIFSDGLLGHAGGPS